MSNRTPLTVLSYSDGCVIAPSDEAFNNCDFKVYRIQIREDIWPMDRLPTSIGVVSAKSLSKISFRFFDKPIMFL